MANHEINAKLNIDTTELDAVIEKVKQLKETLWIVSGLIEELTDENTVDITTTITMDGKILGKGKCQLAEDSEVMNARLKDRFNHIRF